MPTRTKTRRFHIAKKHGFRGRIRGFFIRIFKPHNVLPTRHDPSPLPPSPAPAPTHTPTPTPTPRSPSPEVLFTVVALYDYEAMDETELSFKKGDQMEVVGGDQENWMNAWNMQKTKCGLIPFNYVTKEADLSESSTRCLPITRVEAALKLLLPGVKEGTYILRSCSQGNSMALSVRIGIGENIDIKHFQVFHDETLGKYYLTETNQFLSMEELIEYYTVYEIAENCWLTQPCPLNVFPPMYFRECEIERNRLSMKEKLGEGRYGDVYLAYMLNVPVAVKICQTQTNNDDFLQEAKKMHVLCHKQLVRFIGVCTKPENEPVLLVTEYMANGDLKSFLERKESEQNTLNFMALVDILYQIAKGMEFLEESAVIHRDLRAANVLVDENEKVKIANFGLSQFLEKNDDENRSTKLPIRWTAPEILLNEPNVSSKCDVWSFGVLMYEVLTHGGVPYDDLNLAEVKAHVLEGNRLQLPQILQADDTIPITRIMYSCWFRSPEDRPWFREICANFELYMSNGQYCYDKFE